LASWEHALPVSLSLPLREDRYIGKPVIAVFDNLLPDGDSLRRRIAQRVHAEGTDAYSLLTAVGRDCVGALQFLPDGEEPGPAGAIEGKPITAAGIAHMLGDLETAPLGLGEDDDFRISLAGAQEKTALLRWNDRWYKPTVRPRRRTSSNRKSAGCRTASTSRSASRTSFSALS
jgi:serine/threonine-protein kinase HipA